MAAPRTMGCAALVLVLVLAVAVSGVARRGDGPFRTVQNRIVGADGRERLYHGVNVIYKSSPYIPVLEGFDPNLGFGEQDVALLSSLGLNVIRLGSQWPGVEPQRGNYSQEYIGKLRQIVDMCAAANITVFFDAHQDCFSERFCGEGVPLWAAKADTDFPLPIHAKYPPGPRGVPTPEACAKRGWASYQLTLAGAEGYQRLYQNEDGLADAFADFWAKLALEFKGDTNILGFELLNEPFAGNYFKDPALLYPGHADRVNLQPFFDRAGAAVHQTDPDRIVMFEPCTWSDEFGIEAFDSGYEHVPGGARYANLSIYAYHYYSDVNRGDPAKYFELRRRDMERLGAAGFVTETNGEAEIEAVEEFLQSWTMWEYKAFLPLANQTDLVPICTGCWGGLWASNVYNTKLARSLSRSYPQAIQGRLESMNFTSATSRLEFTYTPDLGLHLPTEVYLNEPMRYPNGYSVAVDAPDGVSVGLTRAANRLSALAVAARGGSSTPRSARTTVQITITAK